MRHLYIEKPIKKCVCTHYHCPTCGNYLNENHCPTCGIYWVTKEQKKEIKENLCSHS